MLVNKSFATLNWTVRAFAIVIGVTAGLGIPVTYGVVAYRAELSRLAYRSELASRRVSEYIYVHRQSWKYQEHRIAELIAFYNEGEHQVVLDMSGNVIAKHGSPILDMKTSVSTPIMVRGSEVGRLQTESGVGPLYRLAGILTLLGIALGAAVFACAHYIPLRALRQAIAEHKKVEDELSNQIQHTEEALKKAQEATRAKSTFLATMSHEIRTPMNAVLGLSSALMDTKLDSAQRHLIDTISDSGASLLRLLNDILDVSKFDAGKVTLEMRAFSPASLLDQTASILGTKAVQKGIDLRAIAGIDLPTALIGDEVRLRQVLVNLADNAIKFTDKGSVEIGMSCREEVANRAVVEFYVRDTGIGIASDLLGTLFTEFNQADPSINRRFGGTGLGLAISKRIIEQMGGEVQVTSALGVGTTFSFALTFTKSDASALASTDHREHDSCHDFANALARAPRRLRVLLAEDNSTNQLVFSHLVHSFNFDLIIAENGQEALEHASAGTFDVVFMDMRMPVMDGLAATRAMRALGGPWTEIPIIALTANAFAEDIKLCHEAGMSDFIAKPIRKSILVDRLAEALKDHPLTGSAADQSHEAETASLTPLNAPALVPADEPVFDHAAFEELVDAIGADGVESAMRVFFKETTAKLARMRAMSCERDRALIKDEAHSIKGASGTLAMNRLSDVARHVERSAMTMSIRDYSDHLDRMDDCFRKGRAEAEYALSAVLTMG